MAKCGLVSRFAVYGLSIAILSILAAGCGSSGPTTHPVVGKVTIGGQPATDLRVDFYPVEPANQMASGTVGPDGSYTLFTGGIGKQGAMAGKYKVVLASTAATTDTSYMDSGSSGPPAPKEDAVPKEYTDAATTPKEVEVTAGSNTIDIQI
jgi:hypothetical protein